MKSIFVIILIVVGLNSCSKANAQTIDIALPSIQCESCVKTISETLKSVEGVEHFAISLKKKSAKVTLDTTKVKQADIEKSIAATGYHANKTLRYATGYDNLDECCREPEEN